MIDDQVSAILTSDWHMWHKAPAFRLAEEDWYAAQERVLGELKDLAKNLNDCPILFAGDLLDKWNGNSELTNFLLDTMPTVYGIPGQHDLCHHSYNDRRKTTYWTLVMAGKVHHLQTKVPNQINDHLKVYAFPWGFDLRPCWNRSNELCLHVALAHKYVWKKGSGYVGASQDSHLKSLAPILRTYDVCVFGDNHKGFLHEGRGGKDWVFNCGTLMRRKSDEWDYRPQVGLLLRNGSVVPHYLDCSKDKTTIVTEKEKKPDNKNLERFMKELTQLGEVGLNFQETVKAHVRDNKVDSGVKRVLWKAMEV